MKEYRLVLCVVVCLLTAPLLADEPGDDLEQIPGDRQDANVRVSSHATTSPKYRVSCDYRVSGVCATAPCSAQTLPNNSAPARSKQSTG